MKKLDYLLGFRKVIKGLPERRISDKRVNIIHKAWKQAKKGKRSMKDKLVGLDIAGKSEMVKVSDILALAVKFEKHFVEVGKHFVERSNELEQIKLAMLTKEHVLLKGKTGTAKSRIGKYSFGYVKDSDCFSIQLSKFMSEEYLFGSIDINKLKNNGTIEHVTKGSLVDCEFAFIDEVFEASDALLRSTLEVLNERSFTRNQQKVKAKLHTAILTSNYVREDEVTEAFLDRILFKSDVQPITDPKNRVTMYTHYTKHGDKGHERLKHALKDTGITYKDLQTLSEFITGDFIVIPEKILQVYDKVVREYSKQFHVYVSDRKANKMLNILKANAVLHGRDMVGIQDIKTVKNALITLNNPQQEEVFLAVEEKFLKSAEKYDEFIQELQELKDIFAALNGSVATRLNPKGKEILELLDESKMFLEKLTKSRLAKATGIEEIDGEFKLVYIGTAQVIQSVKETLKI